MVDGFRNIGEGYGLRGSLPNGQCDCNALLRTLASTAICDILVQGYNTEAVITRLVL